MAEEGVVAGMDLGKLEAFRSALKENPITLGLEARAVWEGHSGRSTVHIGPYDLGGEHIDRETRYYTLQYGAWKEVEEAIGFIGPTDRVEPVEMALGAVGACLTNSIALNALTFLSFSPFSSGDLRLSQHLNILLPSPFSLLPSPLIC